MKTSISLLFFSIALLGNFGCHHGARPIDYGNDMCAFCKMSIVDRQHAAMAISAKGKVYTFDAIECLVPFLGAQEAEWSEILVSDYGTPGKLVPAENAHFLISKGIPSPMGAFATAFARQTDAETQLKTHGGELFDWKGIRSKLSM